MLFKLSILNKENKIFANLLTFVAVLLPITIGGLRDSNVGTDVSCYVEPLYNNASTSIDFNDYNSRIQYMDIEPLFAVVVYVGSLISDKIQGCLIIIEGLCLFFTVMAIKRNGNDKYIVPCMIIYYLYLYNMSFNLMRQLLSASVFLFAYVMYLEKKYVKFIILCVLGFLFHKSIIFGVFLLLGSDVFSRNKSNIKWLVLFFVLYIIINPNTIVRFVIEFSLFNHYETYLLGNDVLAGGTNITSFLVRIFIMCLVVYSYINQMLSKIEFDKLMFFLLFEVFLLAFSSSLGTFSRLYIYATALEIMYVPYLLHKLKKTRMSFLCIISCYALIIFQWYWLQIYNNSNETAEYSSQILGL